MYYIVYYICIVVYYVNVKKILKIIPEFVSLDRFFLVQLLMEYS
jgi:hypothetical protein